MTTFLSQDQLDFFEENGYLIVENVIDQMTDVVILHQFVEHAALPNKTDMIRWSFDLRWNPTGHPSGRPAFPSFVARSRQKPESELRDHELWGELWHTAKDRIVSGDYSGQIFNEDRWKKYVDAPVCA